MHAETQQNEITSGLDVISGDVAVGVTEQFEQLCSVDAHSMTAAALNYSCKQRDS
jgi:hypothetical protein